MKTVCVRLAAASIVGVLIGSSAIAEEPKAAIAVAADLIIVAQPLPVVVEEPADAEAAIGKKNVGAAAVFKELVAPLVQGLGAKVDEKAIDAQIQQWIPQFTEQYKPMLWTELNFIRQTCELTPEQRLKVKAAGDTAIKDAARKMAELQAPRAVRGPVEQPEPRKIIRAALKQALQESLAPDAMQKFTVELNLRAERRKEAAILNAVARLDAVMYLTVEQREGIEAAIATGWKEQWEQWLVLAIYGDQYFPMVPDAFVVGHLNADQKVVWEGLQKVDFGYWGGGAQVEDDEWWGGKAAEPNAKPAAVLFDVIRAE